MPNMYLWVSRFFVALGIACVPIYLVSGPTVQFALSVLVIVSMLPATYIAWRKHHFPALLIVALAAIGTMYVGSTVVAEIFEADTAMLITTPLDLIANSLIIGVFAFIVRRRRGPFTSGDLLDGVIIGLGAWLVAWIALVQPFISLAEQQPLGLIPNALYLPMAAPLLALAAAVAFSSSTSRPAPLLLVAGVIMNLAGDAMYALFEVGHTGPNAQTIANALYLPAFAFSAAAFVHPSATEIAARPNDYRRLALPVGLGLTGISLTVPILVMALVPVESTQDRVVRAVSAFVVLLLVSLRLATATRSHLSAQETLIASARTDDLTLLPNRVAMIESTQESIDSPRCKTKRPSVYLIDIDRFKNTNDSLGHASGDEAIVVIGKRLQSVVDQLGLELGRPAGDEFIVIDPTTVGPGDAMKNAEALHDVFKTPVALDAGVMFLTASIGVATMPVDRAVSAEDMFRFADIAMYRAKDAGRNCIAVYQKSMQERLSHRMAIETALHSALNDRELRLYHQPIVDTRTGRITGFEALMRWQRNDGTLVSPAEFIPIAEETGIITSMGAWALLEALTQLRRWIDDEVVDASTTTSVNVSPRQLADPSFCDVVEEALVRAGVPAHLLWLEVTETMMIENPELAKNTLDRLRSKGIGIALDDFGTGYSSLSLLQQFPIQRVKIDRAFINGVASNSNDQSLVRTIIAMGRAMGLDIVGEGVETVEQLKMLRELGCDKAQGFLISNPVPPAAVRMTVKALASLSQWDAFDDVLGDRQSQFD